MYYITNHDKQIIAADSALINLLKVKNMSELYKEVLLENIQIVPSANKITIKIEKDEKVFDIKSHSLSSLLGNFTLIELIETIQTSEKENDNISKVLTHTEKENKAIENILSLKNKLAENRNKNISLEKDIEEKPEEKIENIAIETPKPMPIPLDDEILDDELFLEGIEEKTEEKIEEKLEEKIEDIAIETPKPMPIPLDDEILDDELFLEGLEEKPEEKIEDIAIETPKPMPIPLDDEILDDELFLEGLEEKPEEKIEEAPQETVAPLDDELFSDDLFAEKTEIEKEPVVETPQETVAPLDDELFSDDLFAEKTEIEKEPVVETPQETVAPLDDELFSDDLFAEKTEIEKEPVVETPQETVAPLDDISSLVLNDKADITIEAIEESTDEPIEIDVKSISESIGISEDDYSDFLNEYIQTANSFEDDLRSSNKEKREETLDTLSHLSNVLQLPIIAKSLAEIKNGTSSTLNNNIKSFYTTLTKIEEKITHKIIEEPTVTIEKPLETIETPAKEETNVEIEEPVIEEPTVTIEEPLETIETPAKEETNVEIEELIIEEPSINTEEIINDIPTEKSEETTQASNGFGTIELDDVEPIHFDFQMEQAATDLGLPVELIEEFVDDFIVQAHEETEKMLKCYEEGDLDAIQKIGHLLKGTSSNLRITPLADTLYEIQFCEDSSKLEKLIKFYWGHFLSLETQIKLTKN